jgi:RNA polymerase sigma factor (sigma-70 family)
MPADPAAVSASQRELLLYFFCRLQLPSVRLDFAVFHQHLQRTFERHRSTTPSATLNSWHENVYAVDWYLCCACLDGNGKAWERLFATRTGRTDCLLLDALRARAVRLYPRNEEKQESAVAEFWSHLLLSENPQSPPILGRYDGQRPLAPWLIRVFQNWHLSKLRQRDIEFSLPDDDIGMPLPVQTEDRWHDAFCEAARDWIARLNDDEILLLGLRLRYRLSQREVASFFGINEGNVSRRTDKLREGCLKQIGERLVSLGWVGDDLSGFIQTELAAMLLDDPRMSAERLASLLAARGKTLPAADAPT